MHLSTFAIFSINLQRMVDTGWYFNAIFVSCFHSLVFMAEMIAFLFFNVRGTHHAKADSLSIPLDFANSTVSTGWDSLSSDNLTHDSLWSFHFTNNFQPAMVFRNLLCHLPVVMYLSAFGMPIESSRL